MGMYRMFSVGVAWEDIRPHDITIDWSHVVCFAHCISRHAFHVWCPLCEVVPDSHNHLFFNCPFSSQIWLTIKVKAGLHNVSCSLDDIVNFIIPFAKSRSAMGVVFKLALAHDIHVFYLAREKLKIIQVKEKVSSPID
ncbi:hypothetical protein Tco_1350683 [Tanacetum coccineum]